MGPWLIVGLGYDSTAPATPGGFTSYLGYWMGGISADQSGVTPAPTKKVVGWLGRRRHRPEELEARLKRQRESGFSRQYFDELVEEAKQLAAETRNAKLKKSVEKVIEIVAAVEPGIAPQFEDAALMLNAALSAQTAAAQRKELKAAELAIKAAIKQAQDDEEEEEAIMLLMLH